MRNTLELRAAVRARQTLYRIVREVFAEAGFDEVETPLLVPAPGMEPHIDCFETRFRPQMGARTGERPLWLHASPEYAMKRLLADGWERIFQITKVFRNGEIAQNHNPEFTMLEHYRVVDEAEGYAPILGDLEAIAYRAALAIAGGSRIRWKGVEVDLTPPWPRLSVREAFATYAGIDLPLDGNARLLRERMIAAGFDPASAETYDDLFFTVFLSFETRLGAGRPVFLTNWPACMASLARLRADDPNVAERFELYIAGVELANGFFELNDAEEQRRRLLAEREERRRLGRPLYPLDERFIEAVGRIPPAAGVATGLDRLLMVLGGWERIEDVLLFPAATEF
ncbi:MAG TPA: EF-P lysine aminoacylase EpmA [Fredinandcohnia sp.]|nr:EF-P lysine aminoacylase EpmA [Fredinandcohnia sp.]